jgi:hypothetical protein
MFLQHKKICPFEGWPEKILYSTDTSNKMPIIFYSLHRRYVFVINLGIEGNFEILFIVNLFLKKIFLFYIGRIKN